VGAVRSVDDRGGEAMPVDDGVVGSTEQGCVANVSGSRWTTS
jgi:hypothetical protein